MRRPAKRAEAVKATVKGVAGVVRPKIAEAISVGVIALTARLFKKVLDGNKREVASYKA